MYDWVEFSIHNIECPHCGNDESETVEFNMAMADSGGVVSPLRECQCSECDKKFWFKARLNFETEVDQTSKKKPKDKN